MVSGDMSLALQLLRETQAPIQKRIEEQPENWWGVQQVAQLYSEAHSRHRASEAARMYLAPLGLTLETFISRQSELDQALVETLRQRLTDYELPGVSLIIAGYDPTGPHLYVCHGSSIANCEAVGFAAIGSGYWHAESHLMLAKHNPGVVAQQTLWNAFVGKKRAEIAPGVGADTDVVFIEQLGGLQDIRPEIIATLNKGFKAFEAASLKQAVQYEKKVKGMLEKHLGGPEHVAQTITKAEDKPTEGKTH